MHTQGMSVDLHVKISENLRFKISPDKRNWKKMFMQTQSMGVDLHVKISEDKHDWKKTSRDESSKDKMRQVELSQVKASRDKTS